MKRKKHCFFCVSPHIVETLFVSGVNLKYTSYNVIVYLKCLVKVFERPKNADKIIFPRTARFKKIFARRPTAAMALKTFYVETKDAEGCESGTWQVMKTTPILPGEQN